MVESSEKNWVEEIGRPAYESVAEMVAALQADRDRLEELREDRSSWEPEVLEGGLPADADSPTTWAEANPGDADELAELEAAVTLDGDEVDEDTARERIEEDPLSVEVRSDWYTPGADEDSRKPAEFNILLGTGGPAVRIRGELDAGGEPSRAWLEVQDWGKPWTQYFQADQAVLLAYCRCFYFGE